ncbi:Bacterial SH3 domain family [Coleofasciculus chthonoplastes PCC 7420]|uniref:Bacterial SH3 domain family n=1 Tax=Coleofasciculus chthonoplastes PCC 7420 TaxID=118168 RepID=B4W5I1_9CYAN|nr:Bacterial SH3 domain family [Coleofasciculus chthonoplastes PCC 7420]
MKSVTGGSYTTPTGSSRKDWYQVEANGKKGYVAAYYVDVTSDNPSPSQPSGFHAESFSGWVGPEIGVALRNSPKHSDRSGLAEPYKKTLHFDGWKYGESVTDIWTGKSDALWYRYWSNGKAYWVPSAYIFGYPKSKPPIQPGGNPGGGTTSKPGHVNDKVGGVPLRLRSGPYLSKSIIGKLSKGTNLTILEQVSGQAYEPGNRTNWYKVKVNGKTGYVAAYYVSEGSSNGGGNNGGNNNYLNSLASWSDWNWEDSINSAADFNYIKNNPSSDIGKLYRDLSNDLFGRYFPPTGAYISDDYKRATGLNSYHGAIDIASPLGTNVKSLVEGEIVFTNPSYFGVVSIKDKHGRYHIYKHLDSVNVFVGQQVKKGDIVGKTGGRGNSRYSFAAHLHYEVTRAPYYKYGAAQTPSVLASKQGIRERNFNPIKTYWKLRRGS